MIELLHKAEVYNVFVGPGAVVDGEIRPNTKVK